jgi:ATP-binding cassette subfamily C protein CydC
MGRLFAIIRLWRGQRLALVLGLVITLASMLAAVLLMVVSGGLVAAAVTGGTLALSLLLKLTGIARVVLRYAERLATHSATFRALADLRVWFFASLARTAAGGLGFLRSGDVLARLVSDVEALDGLYLRILLPLAGGVLLLPLIIDFIGHHDAALAVVVAVLFALSAFVLPWAAALTTIGAGQGGAGAQTGLRTAVLDAVGGLKEVRAYGAEGRMLAGVQARDGALLAAQHGLATRTALAGAAAFLCAQAAILAILVEAPVDTVWAIIGVFFAVAAFEAVGGLTRAGALAGHAAAAAGRVLEVAALPQAAPDPPHPSAPPKKSGLRFEAVGFSWPDRPDVFDSLTLDVPEGAQVAILGPSGAGKSTLAALALKLAAPHTGRILLGGVDIATLTAAEVRARIGWLSQTTHLFDDTIRSNLLLARPEADDAALWAALEAARIADLVRSLPDGLETWVGEGGARFSGGQGRRLALARTLLSPAPLLILDEPGAGLDAETERQFLQTLTETTSGRTVMLIAHRLTGVERLDRLYRLSGGRAMAAAA